MKKVYLVRHGETLFNKLKIRQGWCDSPLTELGIYQAQQARDYFKNNNITFDNCFSSTSERACDTLEIITDHPYTRLKGLKEWYFGNMEGSSDMIMVSTDHGDYFHDYHGGESEAEVLKRAYHEVKNIMDSVEDNTTTLITTHGVFMALFHVAAQNNRDYLQEGEQFTDFPNNCTIYEFNYENGLFKKVQRIDHDFSGYKADPVWQNISTSTSK